LEPTEGDPCRGAVGTLAVLARFLDGKLALFDAVTGELGAQATYKFLDDHTISVDDKEATSAMRGAVLSPGSSG
jgi:hypothetical protein